MTSQEIRNTFLTFFKDRGHTIVPSGPVVPYDDPTLLFTNAGMNQFKDVFLGSGNRPYRRAVDTQKCIRVSGKHNDLEEVGRDTYHHTFFEMLGNWSFGDYYKKEAIAWGWELLTTIWGLPKNRLWATVYKDDDEAEKVWKSVTDIDHTHILRFGEKDNFWEMGETGPCGPCSEIHMDRTPRGTATADMVNAGIAEVMEIWNLVFIQYDRNAAGTLTPLPAKHVDTGMGFERICAVLQNKASNYDTDVFTPVISKIGELVGKPYENWVAESAPQVAMRVIADHVRALTFAISDGAMPSNEGRGYVLRKLLRRAAIFRKQLHTNDPILHRLVPTLVETMGKAFPEISEKQDLTRKILFEEEQNFNLTLDRGIDLHFHEVKRAIEKNNDMFSGDIAFKLHDTFGFPIEETQRLAGDHSLKVDMERFNILMEEQRTRSRSASDENAARLEATKAKVRELGLASIESTRFTGYERLEDEVAVDLCVDNILITKSTPFYGESGGQLGDTGVLKHDLFEVRVVDTQRNGSVHIHILDRDVHLEPGKKVFTARVDKERRLAITRNHTATHLVHEALRRVLGTHVHQAGSLVAPDHLRFDFNHFDRVSPEQLQAIESLVNEKIEDRIDVHALNDPKEWVAIEEAKRRWPNVKMFFGDKYGERVRVVEIDPQFSVELCGGTHLRNTGEIGFFRFRSEGSVASGTRRIEAVTGDRALELLQFRQKDLRERLSYAKNQFDSLFETAPHLKGLKEIQSDIERFERDESPELDHLESLAKEFLTQDEGKERLEEIILRLSDLRKAHEKEAARGRIQSLTSTLDDVLRNGLSINGLKLVATQVSVTSADELKALGDAVRSKLGSGVAVLGAILEEKITLVCVVTDDLVASKKLQAGTIVGAVAKLVGGGGGGRPHMATAGGKDTAKLPEALRSVESIVRSLLN